MEFLRARLDEDAAEIAKQPDGRGEPGGIGIWSSGDAISNTEYLILSKRRALAEVEVKRLFLADHDGVHRCDWGEHRGADYLGWCTTLKRLALPYADHSDHSDYDQEWKP